MADRRRVAVAGGTGLVGRATIDSLREAGHDAKAGHDAMILARSDGIDLSTAAGLDGALTGVDTVIDVSNTPDRPDGKRSVVCRQGLRAWP